MIDWIEVVVSGLRVTGIAMVLSVMSYAGWKASPAGRGSGRVWGPRFSLALNAGLAVLALGLTLKARTWYGPAIAGTGVLLLAARAGHDAVLRRHREKPPGSGDAPARALPQRARLLAIWQQAILLLCLAAVWLTLAGLAPAVLAVGLLLLLWLLGWAAGGFSARSPVDLPVVLLLLASLVGVAVSTDRALSLPALRSLVAGISIYLAATAWIASRQRLALAAVALIAAGATFAALAPFMQTAWAVDKLFQVPPFLRRWAVIPTIVHPNILGGALALTLPVAVSLLAAPGSGPAARAKRAALAFASALMLTMLILSQSRGALIGFAAATIILALRWRPARLAVPGFATVTMGLMVHRLGLVPLANALLMECRIRSVQERLEIWPRAIQMLREHPYTGIGLGTFQKMAPAMYPYLLVRPEAAVPHAHNLFLQVGVDLGIPGLITFLALLMLSALMAWQVQARAEDSTLRSLGAGLLASHVALVIHGLVDAATWGPTPSLPALGLWIIVGLTAAAWRTCRNQGEAGG